MSRWQRLLDFFAIRRSIAGMLGMTILVLMGEKMGERFLPIYLAALVSGYWAPYLIGLLNGLDNLLSALYSVPGGYLSHRIGFKRALVVFNLVAMAGYLLVILVPRWWAVIAGAALFLSWSALSLPATMDLVSKAVPKSKRAMGVSMHSLVRRIPMALGPLIGGWFIWMWGEVTGVRLAFCAALGMAIIGLIMQQRLIEDAPVEDDSELSRNPLRLWPEMSPALRALLVSDILVRFCEQIPDAFVVIWAMKVIASPVDSLQFGVLTTIEMATAVLCYIPVAHMADRFGKRPFVLMTFGFFTLFPLTLLQCHSLWPLVGAFVLRGLKEFGEPTRKALIMDLAPEGRKAAMFGLYYLIRDVVVSVAAFGGGVLWAISPRANLLTAFAFGVLGTAWFAARGRDLRHAD